MPEQPSEQPTAPKSEQLAPPQSELPKSPPIPQPTSPPDAAPPDVDQPTSPPNVAPPDPDVQPTSPPLNVVPEVPVEHEQFTDGEVPIILQPAAPQPAPHLTPPPTRAPIVGPVVTPTSMVAPKPLEKVEKLSLMNLLNKIKCENIVFTDSIGLGDALSRLAVAIGRSGVRFDENGNPTQKQINKELGKLLQETLNRIPRTVDAQPTSIGYDPTRPMFYEGEALSVPINAEMIMLLPLKGPAPVFPATDLDGTASPLK